MGGAGGRGRWEGQVGMQVGGQVGEAGGKGRWERWVRQVGGAGGRGRWVRQVGEAGGRGRWEGQVGKAGGRGRWEGQVGGAGGKGRGEGWAGEVVSTIAVFTVCCPCVGLVLAGGECLWWCWVHQGASGDAQVRPGSTAGVN